MTEYGFLSGCVSEIQIRFRGAMAALEYFDLRGGKMLCPYKHIR